MKNIILISSILIIVSNCSIEKPTDLPKYSSSEKEVINKPILPERDIGFNPINKGLWGVRREDLGIVYRAGFRAVRPPYSNSGSIYTGDNYETTHLYAKAAKDSGFQRLIFDCGLIMMYEEYRRSQVRNEPPRWNLPGTIDGIKAEFVSHLDRIIAYGNGMKVYPYIDEPDSLGIKLKVVGGDTLWPQWNGGDAINCIYVREFAGLVAFADSVAKTRSSHLIIATFTPELYDNNGIVLFTPNRNIPSFYYNQYASELMSSRYWWPEKMYEILNKMRQVYPGKLVSQIMNYFDIQYGCVFSCRKTDIISQVFVNMRFSNWHWFYQGEYILQNLTKPHYHTGQPINSTYQWSVLLEAIYEIENPISSAVCD